MHSGLRLVSGVSLLLTLGTVTISAWWMTFMPAICGDLLWSSFIVRCLYKKVARIGWTRSCLPDFCKVITNVSKVFCFCLWFLFLETNSFNIVLSFVPLWLACFLNICLPMLCRPMVLDRNSGALRQQTYMESLNRSIGQQILPVITSIFITQKLNGQSMDWSFCCSGLFFALTLAALFLVGMLFTAIKCRPHVLVNVAVVAGAYAMVVIATLTVFLALLTESLDRPGSISTAFALSWLVAYLALVCAAWLACFAKRNALLTMFEQLIAASALHVSGRTAAAAAPPRPQTLEQPRVMHLVRQSETFFRVAVAEQVIGLSVDDSAFDELCPDAPSNKVAPLPAILEPADGTGTADGSVTDAEAVGISDGGADKASAEHSSGPDGASSLCSICMEEQSNAVRPKRLPPLAPPPYRFRSSRLLTCASAGHNRSHSARRSADASLDSNNNRHLTDRAWMPACLSIRIPRYCGITRIHWGCRFSTPAVTAVFATIALPRYYRNGRPSAALPRGPTRHHR